MRSSEYLMGYSQVQPLWEAESSEYKQHLDNPQQYIKGSHQIMLSLRDRDQRAYDCVVTNLGLWNPALTVLFLLKVRGDYPLYREFSGTACLHALAIVTAFSF